MGLFDIFKDKLLKGSKKTGNVVSKARSSRGSALKVEEINIDQPTVVRKTKTREKKPTTSEMVDEKQKFIKTVEYLRTVAGLPPVEELRKKMEEEAAAHAPQPTISTEPIAQIPTTQKEMSTPAPAPTPAVSSSEKPLPKVQRPMKEKKTLTKAEIEKMIKVTLKRLENEMMTLLEDELARRGVVSFKERAMARRRIREYIRNSSEVLADEIAKALKSGMDPRSDEFIKPLAKKLFQEVYGVTTQPEQREASVSLPSAPSPAPVEEKPKEQKKEVKKKEKKEDDDLLSLLGESGGTEEEESEDEDLLKLLEG